MSFRQTCSRTHPTQPTIPAYGAVLACDGASEVSAVTRSVRAQCRSCNFSVVFVHASDCQRILSTRNQPGTRTELFEYRYSTGVAKNTRKVRMQGSRIICFVYVRTSLRTVAIRLEYFIRVYAYAYAVHECDISTEIPYEFGFSCSIRTSTRTTVLQYVQDLESMVQPYSGTGTCTTVVRFRSTSTIARLYQPATSYIMSYISILPYRSIKD